MDVLKYLDMQSCIFEIVISPIAEFDSFIKSYIVLEEKLEDLDNMILTLEKFVKKLDEEKTESWTEIAEIEKHIKKEKEKIVERFNEIKNEKKDLYNLAGKNSMKKKYSKK